MTAETPAPPDQTAAAAPTASVPSRVIALDGTPVRAGAHEVAVEMPVQVRIADVPFAVMMLTPADLTDFAYGFCLTEGIVRKSSEIRAVALAAEPDGFALRIELTGDRLHQHLARQRAMTGRTGCGVCGIDDLAALKRAGDGAPSSTKRPLDVATIARALAALDEGQVLNARTRAIHAAAWADRTGNVRHLREDVGRHNALDKLIGALLRDGTDPADGFVLITSRCSFEMVEKAATFGADLVVAISAPTSFAIERAKALGVTLCAIARRDTLTVFTPEA